MQRLDPRLEQRVLLPGLAQPQGPQRLGRLALQPLHAARHSTKQQ